MTTAPFVSHIGQSYPFSELPRKEQQRAQALFMDADVADGYRYELNIGGEVFSRFQVQSVQGQPAPFYVNGYLVHQSTD